MEKIFVTHFKNIQIFDYLSRLINSIKYLGKVLEENPKKDVIFSITIFISDFYENGTSDTLSENS